MGNDKEQTQSANEDRGNGQMQRGVICVTHHFGCDCREAKIAKLLQEIIDGHCNPNDPEYNECEIAPCQWCEEAKEIISK